MSSFTSRTVIAAFANIEDIIVGVQNTKLMLTERQRRMTKDAMLSHVPVPPDHIHPMPVDGAPDDAAARYETLLKRIYGADEIDRARPLFDIMLLGLGGDGLRLRWQLFSQ